MTKAQRRAISHHCRLATETANPQFGYHYGRFVTIILTVNSGYE